MKTRVALYEEPGGQMIIRRDGSPKAFILLDSPAGNFASDAAELATSDSFGRRTRPLDLRELPPDRWPDRTGQLVAIWEEGQVLLFGISRSGGTAEAYEPSWQALRYVGSIDSGTADPG
jgi:hypothetical protein